MGMSLIARLADLRTRVRRVREAVQRVWHAADQPFAMDALEEVVSTLDEAKARIVQLERFGDWVHEICPQTYRRALNKMRDGVRPPGLEQREGADGVGR